MRWSGLGALIAGGYGVLHDQLTYTLCPEYFTRIKFAQFWYADVGLPVRVLVGEIGFLATWWVGFFAVWFVVRQAQSHPPVDLVALRRRIARTLTWVLTGALVGGCLGCVIAVQVEADLWGDFWKGFAEDHAITDVAGFCRVACIHYGGYLGAAVGWIWAMWRTRR